MSSLESVVFAGAQEIVLSIYLVEGEIYMDGYKIVYKEPDGTITDTFFGEPMFDISLPNLSNTEVIMFVFGFAHPGCDIVSIERCSLKEFKEYMK